MNQAVGNTAIVNIVVVFVIIIGGLFVSSLSYSKAYKVKNVIINAIEEHNGYTDQAKDQIEKTLTQMGYRVNRNATQSCPAPEVDGTVKALTTSNNFRYCVWKIDETRGTYYKVTAYMYYDIPLVSNALEFEVHGHTKVFFKEELHD